MEPARVAVQPWPASRPLLAAPLDAGHPLTVISIATPFSTLRDTARAQLRSAVQEVLALRFNCALDTIALLAVPGEALRVELPGHRVYVSFSHEAGISVAAIHRLGPVGIDILRLPQAFEWQGVSRDYLGPQAFQRIAGRPQPEQLAAFACEWTRREACLKCLGVGLREWSAVFEPRLLACHLVPLELSAGLFGAVATAAAPYAPINTPVKKTGGAN